MKGKVKMSRKKETLVSSRLCPAVLWDPASPTGRPLPVVTALSIWDFLKKEN